MGQGLIRWLLNWLTGGIVDKIVSFLGGMWSSYLTARNNSERIQADVINTASETQRSVTVAAYNHWWSTAPLVAFAGISLFYYGKVVVWDISLGLGSTPALRGDIAEMWKYSLMSLTGYGTVLGSAHAIVSGFGRR